MKSVIILSGPVGAGKSTVAQELVAISEGPVAYIEGDKFWFFIAKGAEGQSRLKNFKMVMASMTAAVIPFVKAGYEVILDFSIPPWFLDTIRKILFSKGIPVNYIVLRPSEKVCSSRAAERPDGKINNYEKFLDLYADFNGVEKFTIHNDEIDPSVVAGFIREGVDSGIFRLSE